MAREEHPRAAQVLAAQLLAAAEAIREAADSPMLAFERAEYEEAVAMLSERLGAATLGATWTDGRRLTADEAVALALSGL